MHAQTYIRSLFLIWPFFVYFMSSGNVFVYFMSLGNVFVYFMSLGYVSSWYSGSNLVTPPPTVGYFRDLWGGDWYCHNTPLKMYLSCVSCWEWTKWINSENLSIYKHCTNCIMILIYNYFSRKYIYPLMDLVNTFGCRLCYSELFRKKKIYLISFLHKKTDSGSSKYIHSYQQARPIIGLGSDLCIKYPF